jgi:PhoPQ-activated pathogenicity-related protein
VTALRPLLLFLLIAAVGVAGQRETALDRYVAKSDPAYRYDLATSTEAADAAIYVLDLTSQTWRTTAEVNRTEWKHWLTIIRPKHVKHDTGLLFITGGSNNSKPPAQPDAMLREIAVSSNSVVAELRMVPNQPLTFAGETKGRVEDSLIAWTWNKFLRGGDDNWPARLPMTKAAVRAMDAVTDFCAKDKAGPVKVSKFVVAGASKRGWTTWTTAAVDKRVVAIMPLVIDMLNVEPSFQHHYRVYGFWAPAVGDYVENGIMNWTGTDRYHELMKIVEPYEYRDRLTMPKFMVNATGDQFFLPDSWQFYWKDLKGEKYMRYVPNTDHSLRRSDAADSIHAYYQSVIEGQERPKFDWKIDKDGTIHVRTETAPTAVKLWQATNPAARDFRLEKIGPAWKESALQPVKKGVYEAKVSAPPKGYTAYMVELTYSKGEGHPFKFTTGVTVVPNKEPFPSWQPKKPE